MERVTKLNGLGDYELKACFECGPGCGPENENCGNCEKAESARQVLGKYEDTGLTPDEIPRWIPVSGKLPEPFVSVLVYMPEEVPCPTVHEGYISRGGEWYSAGFHREQGEVTHWMPMPEPPKEKQK